MQKQGQRATTTVTSGRKELRGLGGGSDLYACTWCSKQQRALVLPQQVALRGNILTTVQWHTQTPTIEWTRAITQRRTAVFEGVRGFSSSEHVKNLIFLGKQCT